MVKELRELTGAGILDCKNMLVETAGDMEKAAEALREKGLAKAAKKVGREANEGLIGHYIHAGERVAALVEVNDVNTRAVELAKGEYAVGMISFLSVLDTQRSLFATQTELIQSQQQALIELVNLYEALGGGWAEVTNDRNE